jgi:hypothetical protein
LIPSVDDRFGGLAPHVFGAGVVGKSLSEIDRRILARELRHDLEDGDGKIGKDRVHQSRLKTYSGVFLHDRCR